MCRLCIFGWLTVYCVPVIWFRTAPVCVGTMQSRARPYTAGPVDNRPFTVKLHHFVQRFFFFSCDTCHVIRDSVTCDTWHMTHDIWHVVGGEHSLKISVSYLLWLMIYDILKNWRNSTGYTGSVKININGLSNCLSKPNITYVFIWRRTKFSTCYMWFFFTANKNL